MKKVLFSFTVFFVLAFLALWGYLQTSHAQKIILSYVTEAIQEKTGHDVEIEAFSIPSPLSWIAYNVKVKENENILLSIDQIEASIPYWELLNNSFALKHVTLVNVHIANLPSSKINKPTYTAENTLWDMIPYHINISGINISNLTVDSHLLPEEFPSHLLPLDLNGSLIFNPTIHWANIDLSAKRHANTIQPSTHVHLVCQDSDHFVFSLNLLESKQGLISQAMNLAVPYDLLLSVEGKKAPDKTYDGEFNLKFLDESEIQFQERKLSGGFFYSRNGQLNIHSIKGALDSLSVHGEILLSTADYKIHEGSLFLDITDFSKLSQSFLQPKTYTAGSLKANAMISGTLDHPVIDFKVTGENFQLYGELVENLSGEATLSRSDGDLEGRAFFSGGYKQMQFKTDSIFRWNDKQISLTAIHADYGNTHFEGGLNYILATEVFDGKLDAFAEDSTVLQTLFDINLHGSTALSFKFYGIDAFGDSNLVQNMDFMIQTDRARYNDFGVEKAVLSGIVRNIFKDANADIALSAKHVLYNGWQLGDFSAETFIDRSKNFWPFKISANETLENDLSVLAKGRWQITHEALDVHLESFQGQIKKQPFKLQDPATLYMQNDVFSLSPFSMTMGDGNVFATIDYKADQAHATMRFHRVPLEMLYPSTFMVPFAGFLSGEAYLLGTPQELTGHMQAQLSQIKIFDDNFKQTPPFEVSVSGTIGHSNISCSAEIVGVTTNPIAIKAELPLSATLNPPRINFDEQAPISAHIEAEGEIGPLLQLLVIETSSLAGKTSVSLDVAGTFSDPHMSGDITIANGTFESPNTGAIFHHLDAHLQAHDKILVLKEFKALDLSDGKIQGSGELKLKRDEGFPFTLNLQLSRIRILNLDFVKAIGSGDVIVTGNSRKGIVKGHLTTDSIHATIPEQAHALAHSVEVKYINLQRGEVSPVFTTTRPRWPLEMDIQIDVQKNATIKSKNLSSYWQGAVKVAGMAHAPQLFGDIKIIKGEYLFNGQSFDIKEGTISFAGEPDKKTTLYVIASKDLGKIVAQVILKGSMRNPQVAFRSNPPMSQREILSWILFGQGTTDITPFQGTELSQSISDLTKDSQKKPDVLTKIRDSIGLDRIDISKTEGHETNEVSLQVGKYISRGVLVKINKSFTSQANQVGIEANLWPNIKAEAQVGDDASTQIQLKWKKDY